MRTLILILAISLIAALIIVGVMMGMGMRAAADDRVHFGPETLASSVWDDGKAEVSTYSVERPFYGETRQGEATFLVVKEPWDVEKHVKSDSSSPVEVLKLHRFEEVVTPYYPYRFATSAFVLRDAPGRTVKLTCTSQEWCGTTYQSWLADPGGGRHEWRSYFGAEADGDAMVRIEPGLPVLLVDSLPLTLRSIDLGGGEGGDLGRAQLVGSMVSSHALTPPVRPVTLAAARDSSSDGGAEWRIEARADDGEVLATIWIDGDAPHVMTRAELQGGMRYRLIRTERRAYWPGGDPPVGGGR